MTCIFHVRTLAGIVVIIAVLFQANAPGGVQPTGGSNSGPSVTIASLAPHAARHIVVLSWKASVPASNSPGDSIKGYIVYRSMQSNDRTAPPIHAAVIPGTTCTDDLVENGQTYFYVVRAVNQDGKASGPSNEAKAVIPKDTGPSPAPTGTFLLCREVGKGPLK